MYNERKLEYYIYSICYLIDYSSLNFYFDTEEEIKHLYNYRFNEQGKDVTIYLLPEINTSFTAQAGKNSASQRLLGKLTR